MPESNKTVESIDEGKKRVSFDETFASIKKQKIVHGDAVWVVAVEIESKTLEKNKSVNKQESSSDDKQQDEIKNDDNKIQAVVKKPVKESTCQESSDKEPKPSSEEQSAEKPVSSSCSDDSENDSGEEEGRKHSSEKQSIAPKAEKHDDEPMKPVEAETNNVNTRVEYHKPKPLFSPRPGGSRLVCMRNLSPSIKESDVVEFFKDAGKIDRVRIMMAGDRFLDAVHVKFDTSEAAQKALKRNGEELNGRPVKLFSAMDGTVNDPVTFSSEHKYLFMGNLHERVKESDIIEFFKDDGEVVSVRLLHECGDFFGHVEFASSIVARKALRRYGQMLLRRSVELMLATESSVWNSYTPSSRRPPRFVSSGPGYGPMRNRSSCTTCLRPMVDELKKPVEAEMKNASMMEEKVSL